jgi:outer membrane lipoprotein-sorting protein
MRHWIRTLIMAGCLAAGIVPRPAEAVPPPETTHLSEAARADVARVEAYLNRLGTLKGRFLQVASTGTIAEGTVYISRPGRLRFEYDPPVPILIVANGRFLIFHDAELGQTSHLPLGSTPLGMLLKDEVRLSGTVTVTDVARSGGLLRVRMIETDEPDRGSLTLTFRDEPLRLRQWTTVDAQGVAVTITLMGMRTGLEIDKDLFTFIDPEFFGDAGRE